MRKQLVILDDTRECINAIRFAALRAAKTGGGVQVLAIIPASEIQHGMGVADVMRAEAQERIEVHFEVFAKWMRDRPGVEPELVIREGDPVTELLAQIEADTRIGVVVVGAANDGPGPLVTKLLRELPSMPCPITIVPSDISREGLEKIA
ncbi:universal stress protein [uncultured Paracoccus sp.]|uniref:universal stress protein n=1 Tax=uncultured Paracoccus sp. TaxID=189685 RepID=UPI0025FF8AD5|nr:universal stress protein [uncultured Paracoccus sp.]